MGNPNIIPAYIASPEQVRKAKEVNIGHGKIASIYGYRKDQKNPINPDGGYAPPENQTINNKITDSLLKKFPNIGIVVFESGNETIARFDGKEYYIEITIQNKMLGRNPVQTISEFYSAAFIKMKNESTLLATTHSNIIALADSLDTPSA